uniref:Uncharacterized protein n=2 Tax=Alexandrium monilatum TaxID=311494 RepID=A0A7S4QDL3_9DINO
MELPAVNKELPLAEKGQAKELRAVEKELSHVEEGQAKEEPPVEQEPPPVEEGPAKEQLPVEQDGAATAGEPAPAVAEQSIEEVLSDARREVDSAKANGDLMQQRAIQAAKELELERLRVEQSRRECAELSKERADALASARKAERTRAALEAKLAKAEKALQLTKDGKVDLLADGELLKDLQLSPQKSGAEWSPGGKAQAELEAEAALAEERKRTETAMAEYEKTAADHSSALDNLQEAERTKAALEAKLATVEQLLKNTESNLVSEAADAAAVDEQFAKLQAEVKQHQQSRTQLELGNAELGARHNALQSDLEKKLAANAALKEELERTEGEVRMAQAILPRNTRSDEISEHARKLADDVTSQAFQEEADAVEHVEEPPLPEVRKAPPVEHTRTAVSRKCSTPKKHRKLGKIPSPSPDRRKPGKVHSDKDLLAGVRGEDYRSLDKKLREIERRQQSANAGEEPSSVHASMKVKNIEYAELCANPVLLGSFKDSLRRGFALAAGSGVRSEHVEIALSAGSVVVQAKITPPKGVPPKEVAARLKSASLEITMVAAISSVDGLREVSRGAFSISEARVYLPEPPVLPADATKGHEQPLWRPEAGGHKDRSSSRTTRDGKAQREREARRARRALEDAIVLASRIQLLRAEGARTRKKIHVAQEKKQAVVVASQQARKNLTLAVSAEGLGLAGDEAEGPGLAAERTLAGGIAANREALERCNLTLKAEIKAAAMRQAQAGPGAVGPADGAGPNVSFEVLTKMAAAKNSLDSFNLAVRNELEQLAGQLSGLLKQRAELRQGAARPCWEPLELS